MPFFALKEDKLVSAWDGSIQEIYLCLECRGLLKLKQRKRCPHFYHISSAPSCRLYSKSEDHLLIQLGLQKIFPPGEVVMEKPFLSVGRVADLFWERENIVFEIQCSFLFEPQAKERISAYRQAGIEVIWILDDRIFNKRKLRPAEMFLRHHQGYFVSSPRKPSMMFYDQHEILIDGERVKKGQKLPIQFSKVKTVNDPFWPEKIPEQLVHRIPFCVRYFQRDLIDRVLSCRKWPFLKESLEFWWALEMEWKTRPSPWTLFWRDYLWEPYCDLIEMIVLKVYGEYKRSTFLQLEKEEQEGK